jgi:hypothetical protein
MYIVFYIGISRSRDSSFSIKIGRFRFLAGARLYLLHSIQTGSGAHPASYPMGTGGDFLGGVKAVRVFETEHSPPSSVEVKNGGAIPLLPHMFS